jgi:peptide chain release factor 1
MTITQALLPQARLDKVLERHLLLQQTIAAGATTREEFVRASKEYAALNPVVEGIEEYRRLLAEIADSEIIVKDAATDAEMRAMAEQELQDLRQRLAVSEQRVRLSLLPKDAADEKSAILELRAGTGGEEAALFAADLFRMYQRYSDAHGWKFEVMGVAETDRGGYREATAAVNGRNVFARLKFESGVHRVQRVPLTEGGGRLHTSTATVAVLPEAEDVDIKIEDKDLRIDVFRSSGPGGQSVNTTDSAVRITHLPTGVVVSQQDEKSQHRNRAKAMKVLRARLYDLARQTSDAQRAAVRKDQIGTGDRSERVRTYNYPQNRVSDHRINLTLHNLDKVISGEALDSLIDALISEDQARHLAAEET